MEEEFQSTPPEIKEQIDSQLLLPTKSSDRYEKEFNKFLAWLTENGGSKEYISQNILLAYFQTLAKDFKPSTLWSIFSMLHKMLGIQLSLDLGRMPILKDYLKQLDGKAKKKKSAIFSRENIEQFLRTTPDNEFLLDKVSLSFGLAGGLQKNELTYLTWEDIVEFDEFLRIRIQSSKTDKGGQGWWFSVEHHECSELDPLLYFQKYKDALKFNPSLLTGRIWKQCRKGRWIQQVRGEHYFGKLCKRIAEFLQLENVEQYTSHCIRRTAATLMANAGVSSINLKRFGRWKSESVAMGYLEDSETLKRSLAQTLIHGETNTVKKQKIDVKNNDSSSLFSNCTFYKCTVNVAKSE